MYTNDCCLYKHEQLHIGFMRFCYLYIIGFYGNDKEILMVLNPGRR